MLHLVQIKKCEVAQCCYNKETVCHALAITVGDGTFPRCDTYTTECKAKAGDAAATGYVGACKVSICRFNKNLTCDAPGIVVGHGADEADCLTFEAL